MYNQRYICCPSEPTLTMNDALMEMEKEVAKTATKKRKATAATDESREENAQAYKVAQVEAKEKKPILPFDAHDVPPCFMRTRA